MVQGKWGVPKVRIVKFHGYSTYFSLHWNGEGEGDVFCSQRFTQINKRPFADRLDVATLEKRLQHLQALLGLLLLACSHTTQIGD